MRKGPWALRHLLDRAEGEITLVTGGFAYAKAKPIMTCEWRILLPAAILDNIIVDEYQAHVNRAEAVSRFVTYALEIHLKIAEKNLSFKDKENRKVYQSLLAAALKRYWHGLETCAARLLTTLTTDAQKAREDWDKDVFQHALKAFEEACSGYAKKDLGAYVNALNYLQGRIKNGDSNGSGKGSGTAATGAAEEQSSDGSVEKEFVTDTCA
jgi:hypothetical protein